VVKQNKLRSAGAYAQTLRSLFITFVVVVSRIQRHSMVYVKQPCRPAEKVTGTFCAKPGTDGTLVAGRSGKRCLSPFPQLTSFKHVYIRY